MLAELLNFLLKVQHSGVPGSIRADPLLKQLVEVAQGAVMLTKWYVSAGRAQLEFEDQRVMGALPLREMVGELSPFSCGSTELASCVQLLRLFGGPFNVELGLLGGCRRQEVRLEWCSPDDRGVGPYGPGGVVKHPGDRHQVLGEWSQYRVDLGGRGWSVLRAVGQQRVDQVIEHGRDFRSHMGRARRRIV